MSKVLRILGAATFTLLILGAPVLAFYLATVHQTYWFVLLLVVCLAEFVILSRHWCFIADLDDESADFDFNREFERTIQEERDGIQKEK